VGGVPTTFANWEAQLSSGDSVTGTYADSAAAVSTFDLTDSNPGQPTLVDAVAGGIINLAVGTNSVTVDYNAPGGDVDAYGIWRALSLDGTTCGGSEVYAKIATDADADANTSYTDSTVGSPEEYCYQVTAVNDGDESSRTGAEEGLAVLSVADASAPTIAAAVLLTDVGLVGVLDSGDQHRFAFSEVMFGDQAPGTFTGIELGSYRVIDADGTQLDVFCGATNNNATCVLNDVSVTVSGTSYAAGRVLTVTLTGNPTLPGGGTTAGFQYPGTVSNVSAEWDDLGGNQLNLAGSADKVIG